MKIAELITHLEAIRAREGDDLPVYISDDATHEYQVSSVYVGEQFTHQSKDTLGVSVGLSRQVPRRAVID